MTTTPDPTASSDFIRDIIRADVQAGRNGGQVVTRFPPEPNGYLHIGHAKAICLDFGSALEFGGRCHLRMDDTNPAKETTEYVEGIRQDVHWLGFDWGEHFYYSADYFERMYAFAADLIRAGKAYACSLTQEEWKDYRGIPTQPGRESPHRNRPAAESLDLFARMRAGEFADGTLCLRAKIDMASSEQATPGASTRPTTSRTRSKTPSKASPTRSARSSSRCTARSTTGSSSSSSRPSGRARSSSPGST